jgi:predicted nucleic-acid-binding protein
VIALDTNVLVRYLLLDDETQSPRAAALINGSAARGEKMFVSHVVLCEVTWVLRTAASLTRDEVAAALTGMIRTAQFVVEDPDIANRALHRYEAGGADFADYLIAERAAAAGFDQVVTFDKKLLKESGFIRP